MNTLKIHFVALIIMLALIFLFLGLSDNGPSSTLDNSSEKSEFHFTGKSLENYRGESFSTGAASLKCSQLY